MVKQSKFYLPHAESKIDDISIVHTDSDSFHEVVIRLKLDTQFKIVGVPSGREYFFNGAGAEVKVALEDVEFFLEQHRGASCCGGTGYDAIFEKVI